MAFRVHIDSFQVADDLRGKHRTYATVKAAVLKAGRFSCFEASQDAKSAAIFTDLCRDPEIETIHEPEFGYPWTGVRLRQPK